MKNIILILIILLMSTNCFAIKYYLLETVNNKVRKKQGIQNHKNISLWNKELKDGESWKKVTEDKYYKTKLDPIRTKKQKNKNKKLNLMQAKEKLDMIAELEQTTGFDFKEEKDKWKKQYDDNVTPAISSNQLY